MEEKNKIISLIREYHPAEKPDKYSHYSEYVGGMKDTGQWFYEIIINDTLENLQECLNLLSLTKSSNEFEEKKKAGKLVEIKIGSSKYWYDVELAEQQRKFYEELEIKMYNRLFHGVDKN